MYSANTMLVFNSWIKDMEMCIKEQKVTNLESVQLIKDYTTENTSCEVDIYLDSNSMWDCQELIKHFRSSREFCKTFSSLVSDFTVDYNCHQKQKTSLPINCKY